MKSFWHRLARRNAPFIARELRALANEVEALEPGSPVIGFMHFNIGGSLMENPTVPDNQAPFIGTITWLDAVGNPTTPAADEPVTIASDNESVATAVANDDGTVTVTVVGAGGIGAAVISADATNESGDNIHVQGTVTVIPSDMTSGTMDFAV